MGEVFAFYLLSGLTLGAALIIISSRQPVYCVLSLLASMFCLAGLFVLLGAYFVAALQILLYAGAVLVLFLFVIMLLRLDQETLARLRPFSRRGVGILVALAFCAELIWLLRGQSLQPSGEPIGYGVVERVGRELFTTYLIPFELTSFLILAAIVGAITLARSNDPSK